MSKFLTIIASVVAIGALLTISSCKEDEPPVKPVVSFETDKFSVAEGTGTVNVEIELSAPAPSTMTIEYTLAGTAVDLEVAPNVASADYSVEGGSGELEIEKGATSGVITLEVIADNAYEGNETIEIELDNAGVDATVNEEASTIEVTIVDDDEKAIATIATAPFAINEDDAIDEANGELTTFEIQVSLDKPAGAATTINYELSGTALDTLFAYENQLPGYLSDYYIDSETQGQLTIPTGQTTGTIKVKVYPDFCFEPTAEQIIVTLVEGGSSSVTIGEDKETTITINQQDGKVLALSWDDAAYTDVDMDLFLWIGEDVNNTDEMGLFALSTLGRTTPKEENIIIPDALFVPGADVAFGASYVYYAGTASPMTFEVIFADYQNGVLEDDATRDKFTATYTTANINKYDQSGGTIPAIEQTFTMTDNVYGGYSAITVPTTGSRVKKSSVLRSEILERYFIKPKIQKGK